MLSRRRDNAWLQSNFYRDQFRKLVRWLIISVLIMVGIIAATIYVLLSEPPQLYYANTVEGKILNMPKALPS